MNFMLCCHAKHQWESQLCYIPITVFFFTPPCPSYYRKLPTCTGKILLGCNKGTIKGFFQIPQQPDKCVCYHKLRIIWINVPSLTKQQFT